MAQGCRLRCLGLKKALLLPTLGGLGDFDHDGV